MNASRRNPRGELETHMTTSSTRRVSLGAQVQALEGVEREREESIISKIKAPAASMPKFNGNVTEWGRYKRQAEAAMGQHLLLDVAQGLDTSPVGHSVMPRRVSSSYATSYEAWG
eukprot:scaffold590_cov281-Pinguiococcus_pyrenoidosus.AAC.2